MGAATDRQPKSKRKRRKLFVQDRSFFGDESLTYPEANPTTIDGDILKLKVPSKSQSKRSRKHNHVNSRHSNKVTAVHHDKFDKKEAKMDRLKRKREDSQDSKAPASKKHKSGSLDADADAHVNSCGQLDECSPIIDVVHISSNPSESSNIPGHHEEWHFSSLDNSVVEVNSCAPRSNSTEHQSAKKKDLINRFLSDAVSTLGMSEKCLASSGDELSSDDITEAADLISSHHRNQSRNVKGTSCRTSRVRNNISELSELSDLSDLSEPSDLKRAKCSKTRNEFSDKSPLSSGQMWLLRQILPSDNYLSTANPEERCSSPVNSLHSDSAESVQILEHIKPPTATTTKKKSKKNKRVKERKVKKTKEKKKKRKKKKTERDQEKLCKETNKLRKNTDELLNITEKEADCKGKHEQIVVGNKEKGKHHNQKEEERKRNEEKKTNLDSDVICASTNMLSYFGSKSEDNKRHEECENKLNKIGSLKVFRKKKEVSVQMQLTNEVILHLPSGRNLEETVSSPKSQLGDSVKKKKTEDRNAPKFDVSTVQELLSEDADNVHFGNSLETHEISVAATESTNESERRKSKKVITNGSKEAKILYSEPICNDTDQPNQTDYFNCTSDETNEHIDVSMLENSQVNHENSLDELHKNFSLVGKKMKETSQRMECCKVACSETLQQLVEKASSSLKNCENYSTNEYSPDLFDGTVEDTNSLERNQKKNAQPGAAQEEILNKNRVMSELGNCETLQQLVHKASTSLRNCESTSTIDCSPDMFDANAVVTSKAIHIKKKSRKNRTHVSDPGESPLSYTVSSNEQGKLSGEERQQANKTPCLENVSTNSSPEVLESCSPWHRLTQDSNGSFTARSEEISEVSPQETGSHLHKNIFTPHSSDGQGIMNKSHGSQRLNTSCSVGANESSLEETLTSAAALSLQLNNPKVILPKNREPASNSEAIKKRVSKEGSCSNIKLNKKLVKSRSSQNESEPPENSRIPPSLSKNSPNKQSIKKNAGKIVESKVKDVVKRHKMKCTRCRTLFDTELLMALHKCISGIKQRTVEEPHRTDYADYKCEICGKVYVMIQSLREHVKLVHEGVRRYKCDECPMAFGVKQTLIVHKRLHTNTLPFECRICSKLTRTKGNLHRHYSQAHRLTANFPCDICPHKNVWCFFEQDLKEHLEKFHSQSIISTIKTL